MEGHDDGRVVGEIGGGECGRGVSQRQDRVLAYSRTGSGQLSSGCRKGAKRSIEDKKAFRGLRSIVDGLVVVCALAALGIPVPWSSILVIYALTQVAASLPITPGGIGVVDSSLAALLHAYGVAWGSALSAVLLYRLIAFWFPVPLGWLVFGVLHLWTHHTRPKTDHVQPDTEAPAIREEPESPEPDGGVRSTSSTPSAP
jgi:hypothetical protein